MNLLKGGQPNSSFIRGWKLGDEGNGFLIICLLEKNWICVKSVRHDSN
jgi:hypothetical protein